MVSETIMECEVYMLGLAVFFLTFFASKNMGKEILSGDSPLEKTLQENK